MEEQIRVKDVMFALETLLRQGKISANTKVCMNESAGEELCLKPIYHTPSVVPNKHKDFKGRLCIN